MATVLAFEPVLPEAAAREPSWPALGLADCGGVRAKPAYGYRRVVWWLKRKEGLRVNRRRVLQTMRKQGLLVPSRRLRVRRGKEWGRET